MYKLKFYINVGEVSSGGLLAPMLAPYGFELNLISKDLNEKSQKLFVKGLPVKVDFYIFSNKKYKIDFGFCSFNFLLHCFLNKKTNNLDYLDFYNLLIIYKYNYQKANNLKLQKLLLILLGNLKSFNEKIKISF